jgi:hypothetical protein
MSRSQAVRFDIASTWDGGSIPDSERITLTAWFEEHALHLSVDAPYHGDSAPGLPPGPTPKLWNYEVVEFFLVGGQGHYTEIEMGPHGHHLVLKLSGPREVVADSLPLKYEARIEGVRWTATASLSMDHLPAGPYRANACAIHGQGETRRYLSAVPLPGPAPDFHRLELFPSVELLLAEAAEGAAAANKMDTELSAGADGASFSGQTEILSAEEIETAQSLNRSERRAASERELRRSHEDRGDEGGLLLPIVLALLFLVLITGLGTLGVKVIKYQLSGEAGVEPGGQSNADSGVEPVRWITPDRAEASSTRAPSKQNGEWQSCYASNAIDGLANTAWCEGRPTDGLGESLTLTLTPRRLRGLRLIASLGVPSRMQGGGEWSAANRISVLQVQTFDGEGAVQEEQLVSLTDSPAWQHIELHRPGLISSLMLTVVEVYPSTKSRGEIARRRITGIAEVELQAAEPRLGVGERE